MSLELEKTKNVITYLAENVSNLYFTKLLKLLYYFDFISVLERGEPATGDTYYHLPLGPVPTFIKDQLTLLKADVKQAEDSCIQDSGINSGESIFSGYVSLQEEVGVGFKVIKQRNPDMSQISEYEKGLLDNIISDLGTKTAKELVTQTHAEPPYAQTTMRSIIDYKLAFYLNRDLILPSRKSFSFNVEVSQAEYFSR